MDVIDVILPIQLSESDIPITFKDRPDLLDNLSILLTRSREFLDRICERYGHCSIALRNIDDAQVVLRKLFVRSQCRKSRHQVGARLLRMLRAWCQDTQTCKVFLLVRPRRFTRLIVSMRSGNSPRSLVHSQSRCSVQPQWRKLLTASGAVTWSNTDGMACPSV